MSPKSPSTVVPVPLPAPPLPDDGKLSLEEFQSYFGDAILTQQQMQELYHAIDRQQTE